MTVPVFFLALLATLAATAFVCSTGAKGRMRTMYLVLVQLFLLIALLDLFGMVFLWRPS